MELAPENEQHRNDLFKINVRKAFAPFDKMMDDTTNRLAAILELFRACRLFNAQWVAGQSIESLQEELIRLKYILHVNNLTELLDDELPRYYQAAIRWMEKRAADGQQNVDVTADQLWSFWKSSSLNIPSWFSATCEVALIMPSSSCVERIFALYNALFTNNQQSALEDMKQASVMIKFNENQRKK